MIGAAINNIPISELKKLTLEERLKLDLNSLRIICKECSTSEQSGYRFNYKSDNTYTIDNYWLISLFTNGENFHFLRKSYNGDWHHKMGYFAYPINYDSDGNLITNPGDCNIEGYQYFKTYKLLYRTK